MGRSGTVVWFLYLSIAKKKVRSLQSWDSHWPSLTIKVVRQIVTQRKCRSLHLRWVSFNKNKAGRVFRCLLMALASSTARRVSC